ncbi:hypothetical protein [uncultured Clostridium sp.]|uniref:hypothetical protein n=1 Tax=uncultured Clostridium sp. TaxID=59620 RepID=UPI002671065D|nr:hypothetical protein [uncultured Clostridium sp.]
MKKKFLSLMMAAAVVATTSVSAFAANEKTVTNDGESVEVQINGIVNNSSNEPPAGTLNVTVPTALSFTVDNNVGFVGSNITVTNAGTQAIDVYAYQFTDVSPTKGIVIKQDQLEKKSDVSLSLNGNAGIAHFRSEANGKGIYDEEGHSVGEPGAKIANIEGGDAKTLYLNGSAGTAALESKYTSTGINEKFTLRLKIKKAA